MTITDDDEREAREWLDRICDGNKHARTIWRLLDAPRMPHPEELTEPVMVAMMRGFHAAGEDSFAMRAAYRALYDHYTAPPQPKKVVAWAAVDEDGIWATDKDENMIRKYLAHKGCRIVRLVEDRDGE